MPKSVSSAQLIAGCFDISSFTGMINETPGSRSMKEANNFAALGYQVWVPSIRSGKWGLQGWTDHTDATGIASAINTTHLGTAQDVSIAVPTSGATVAAGDWAQFGVGNLSAWSPIENTIDEVLAFNAEWTTTGGFAVGRVAAPLASRTTSGLTGTAVSMTGPAAGQRLYALLQVSAAAGTNLVVKIQSDDNSSFTSATDRITFSTTSAVGYQLSSVAGDLSTETYWRATATIASSTFSFAVHIGVA